MRITAWLWIAIGVHFICLAIILFTFVLIVAQFNKEQAINQKIIEPINCNKPYKSSPSYLI